MAEILDEEALRHLWPPAAPMPRPDYRAQTSEIYAQQEEELPYAVMKIPMVPFEEDGMDRAGDFWPDEQEAHHPHGGHGHGHKQYGHHGHHDPSPSRGRDTLGDLLVRLGLLGNTHPALHRPHRAPCPMRDLAEARARAQAQTGADNDIEGAEKERSGADLLAELNEALGWQGEAVTDETSLKMSLIGGPDKVRGIADRYRGQVHPAHEHDLDHQHQPHEKTRDAVRFAQSNDVLRPLPAIDATASYVSDSLYGADARPDRLNHHHHHHHHQHQHAPTFRRRLHRALLALHPTEALAMAFVVGAGIGAVIYAFGVLVILALGRLGLIKLSGGRRRRGGARKRCTRRCGIEVDQDALVDRPVSERYVDEKKEGAVGFEGKVAAETLPPYRQA